MQDFLDQRRRDRFNRKHNQLLDAWLAVALGRNRRNAPIELSPFDAGDTAANPRFLVGSRTAFTRRLPP